VGQGGSTPATSLREVAPMTGFRRAALFVALANLAWFGVEFAVALDIGSVSLFADSIDFLEDTAVNLLVVVALGWSLRRRGQLGTVLAGLLLVPAAATLWMAWRKFMAPVAPAPEPLTIVGLGAMAINLACAFALAAHRHSHGSLSRAAFLSARNDVIANVAIVAAGLVTLFVRNAWPDLVVGLGIGALNAGAAKEVFEAAREERLSPQP
jgi:Co/Zn/Cd efflux system component